MGGDNSNIIKPNKKKKQRKHVAQGYKAPIPQFLQFIQEFVIEECTEFIEKNIFIESSGIL